MRQYLPDGEKMPPEAFVFGDEVGGPMTKNVLRNAWERLRSRATKLFAETEGKKGVNLKGIHLADLRHEAGSRYADADVPLAHVSKMLGHTNLTTTTRYLNVTDDALRRAVAKLESSDQFARSLQGAEKAKVESEHAPAEESLPSDSKSVA
jgi:integrase